jgi:hypothetical protein
MVCHFKDNVIPHLNNDKKTTVTKFELLISIQESEPIINNGHMEKDVFDLRVRKSIYGCNKSMTSIFIPTLANIFQAIII